MSYHGVDKSTYQQGPSLYGEQHLTQETEGGKIAAQTAVGITQDAIEAAILQGHKYGREEAMANHPTLQFPTYVMRASTPLAEETKTDWNQALEELIEKLPEDLQERVRYEMNLPFGSRNEDYSSLITALSTLAFALAVIKLSSQEIDPSSQTAQKAEKNVSFGKQAFSKISLMSQELTQNLGALMEFFGRGHPHIEGALELSSLQKEINAQLDKWGKNIQEEGLRSKEKGELDQLIRQLYSAKDGVFAKTGGKFHILSNLLNVEITAFSMLGASRGIKPSLLGLSLASIGVGKGVGFFGKNSSLLLDKAANGALTMLGIEKNSSEGHFIKPLLAFAAEGVLLALHVGLSTGK